MKPIPDTDIFRHVTENPISIDDPDVLRLLAGHPWDYRHARSISTDRVTSYDRAVIALRLLSGAPGTVAPSPTRTFEDCFEMFDGRVVVGHLLRMADTDTDVLRLLAGHPWVGQGQIDDWRTSVKMVPHPHGDPGDISLNLRPPEVEETPRRPTGPDV